MVDQFGNGEFEVVGIDWATEPKNRAIARIRSNCDGALTITQVSSPLVDSDAIEACNNPNTAVVSIDIPFGWPRRFTEFTCGSTPCVPTKPPPTEDFRYRTTDKVVKNEAWKTPLSISSDRIAMGTRSWFNASGEKGLENQIDVIGNSATSTLPRIIEVYPGGTLSAFARDCEDFLIDGYKGSKQVRSRLLQCICNRFRLRIESNLRHDEIVGEGDESDQFDAVVAALTGVLYAVDVLGYTLSSNELCDWNIRCPNETELNSAQTEGWIFFPVRRRKPAVESQSRHSISHGNSH